MGITIRQTLLFTILTACLLLMFSLLIDYGASRARMDAFYGELEKEAVTKLNLIVKTDIGEETLQTIYRENRAFLHEVEVAVYDNNLNLLYHDDIDIDFVKETPEMLNEIAEKRSIRFTQENWQVVGLRIDVADTYFLITAAAFDAYGYNKLNRQRRNMVLSFLVMLVLLYLVGRYFVKKTLSPLQEVLKGIRKIGASSLHRRVPVPERRDELAELAETFNNMLGRLENAFASQQSFVSNVAHELRTPLSGILAEIELTLEKPRDEREYTRVLKNVAHDARQLTRLSSSLLDLAKAGYDPSSIVFSEVRVDEVLLDALSEVQREYPNAKIDVEYTQNFSEDDNLSILGNAYLLKVAFINLLDNACKYSDEQRVSVLIDILDNQRMVIKFIDHGQGIQESELDKLFTPFYRGSNRHRAPGVGIGLSLVKRIIDHHKGEIKANSVVGKGTEIIVTLFY
ncbi:MAG: HAMP domain-containing histidine kinase [Cryomorphaceae bacterium]|nr:HAMP domain-containing histidine kinase [Cryomorphaceae bacterium]